MTPDQVSFLQAWILTEGRTGEPYGSIIGVALTNESASDWVGRNDEPGYWRSSAPYPVIQGTVVGATERTT